MVNDLMLTQYFCFAHESMVGTIIKQLVEEFLGETMLYVTAMFSSMKARQRRLQAAVAREQALSLF